MNVCTAKSEGCQAFVLVELLVVVTILSVLMATLIPQLNSARERAKRSVCRSHLMQLGLGVILYGSDNNSRIPPAKTTKYKEQGYFHVYQSTYAYETTVPEVGHEQGKRLFVFNHGYLHQNAYVTDPRILYCPSAPKQYQYETYAYRISWPFENNSKVPPSMTRWNVITSYHYVPQGNQQRKLANNHDGYVPVNSLLKLNNRAPLLLDCINYRGILKGWHRSSRDAQGVNILTGDRSVRFRTSTEVERALWDAAEKNNLILDRDSFSTLLYLFSQ